MALYDDRDLLLESISIINVLLKYNKKTESISFYNDHVDDIVSTIFTCLHTPFKHLPLSS